MGKAPVQSQQAVAVPALNAVFFWLLSWILLNDTILVIAISLIVSFIPERILPGGVWPSSASSRSSGIDFVTTDAHGYGKVFTRIARMSANRENRLWQGCGAPQPKHQGGAAAPPHQTERLPFWEPKDHGPRGSPHGGTGARLSDFAQSTMIWQGVCYVELKESCQGTHMTQPGPPLKGNGCRRRWSEMQGQVPAAKQH